VRPERGADALCDVGQSELNGLSPGWSAGSRSEWAGHVAPVSCHRLHELWRGVGAAGLANEESSPC